MIDNNLSNIKDRDNLVSYVMNLLVEVNDNIILSYFNNLKSDDISTKTNDDDFVTIADKKSEEWISNKLLGYLNINKFKGESSLFTWMYRIATNESINFIKSKSSKMGLQNQEWIESKAEGLQSDSYFDGDEAALILQKLVAKLPEKQRIVFNMRYFDGMNYESISQILETSVGALKASYHHASTKIKSKLND